MKTLISILVFVALLFAFASSVKADDILLGQYTKHDSSYYPKNCYREGKYVCNFRIKDEHALLGVNSNGYTVFFMENSYERPSLNILKTYSFNLASNIRPYVSVGIMTGYDNKLDYTYFGITPAVYTGVDIHPKSDSFGITITYVPNYFIGVGFRKNIGDIF